MSDDTTRTVTKTIALDATPDQVWQALTDPEELVRWFPLEARVEPGEGGSIYLGWPEPWHFDTRISRWQPGRHLRLVEQRDDAKAVGVTLAMDFLIEAEGDATILRLVHSGFGADTDWDDEVEGVEGGWTFELRSLRHYLARHRGRHRSVAFIRQPTSLGPREAARKVLGPEGLLAEGSIDGLSEGDAYRIVTALGETFEGAVLVNRPTHLAAVVRNLDDAILRFEAFGADTVLTLATWGDSADTTNAFENRWRPQLAALL